MWALNCAHNYSYEFKETVDLTFHWEHGEDYLHHFEDPETIIERLEYIHNFYHRKEDVVVNHVFNSTDPMYSSWKFSDDVIQKDGEHKPTIVAKGTEKKRFWFEDGWFNDEKGRTLPYNDWAFRQDSFLPKDDNKIVVWTPILNAETPRTWKRLLPNREWYGIINLLRRSGFNVVELSYRTPVREAMYHISNCRLVFCYDGMWHYIARNFFKPMIVMSDQGVTTYHTPQAQKLSPNKDDKRKNIYEMKKNMNEFLGLPKKRAVEFQKAMQWIYD